MADRAAETTPWRAIVSLAMTVMVGFGVILYGFSIYVTDGAAGADFSKTLLSAAYGGSVVAGGLLAIPIGRRADRVGVRGILALGGLLAAIGMTIFGAATAPWQVLVAWWIFIGPAGAMIYYEVAFVAVDRWCSPRQRPRALGALTLIGGLAGIIFIPLTQWLVAFVGWRTTAFTMGALVMGTALATTGIALREVDRVAGRGRDKVPQRSLTRQLLKDRRFVTHTSAMILTFFAAQGIIAHRVALFNEAGFSVNTVALWAAAASALSLPGRWVAPLLATRFRAADVQAAATVLLAVGTILMLDGTASWQMIGHFAVFGVAFGAVLPLRAMTMATWFSGPRYGATMGTQWTVTTIVGAFGPVAVALLRDVTVDYQLAVTALVAALSFGALLLFISTRSRVTEPEPGLVSRGI
ncbi:MAG: MFS transporter [Actinomycetota bacterium]|nr:MFS transporter [Actinomycetota bacterium]